MRPYLAIIKDSFRAAIASRMLYVLLALITILLILLAPVHLRESLNWRIDLERHVSDPDKLIQRLVEKKDSDRRPDMKRIWGLLSPSTQAAMTEIYEEEFGENAGQSEVVKPAGPKLMQQMRLIDEFNEIVKNPDFYRAEDWEKRRGLTDEAKALIAKGPKSLSELESRRLNRLLFTNAFRRVLDAGPPAACSAYYAVWTADWLTFPVTLNDIKPSITSSVSFIFDKYILSIGLLIAIIVTANIIPETFEPGSLNLLLSKPVSRWSLFLTKFIGGCAMVALCSAYLFLGTWLWLGFGMGVWDKAFLLSIPLYILVFAIYYSVSSLVGLTYRSTIMAVVLTGLFWVICFVVGTSYYRLDAYMKNSALYGVTAAQDRAFGVNAVGSLMMKSNRSTEWKEVASPELAPEEKIAIGASKWVGNLHNKANRLPPLYHPRTRQVYVGLFTPTNPSADTNQDFWVGSGDSMSFEKIGKFPRDAMAMFSNDQGLLVANGGGKFFHFQDTDLKAFRLKSKAVGPDKTLAIAHPGSVALNRSTQQVAVYGNNEDDQNVVSIYEFNGAQYIKQRDVPVDTGATSSINGLVEYQGKTLLVVAGNGRVIIYDTSTDEVTHQSQPESRAGIEMVQASPDGRWFALLYKNGTMWLVDTTSNDGPVRAGVGSQGNITAVSFDAENQIWVTDYTDRVSCYQPETRSKVQSYSASGGIIANGYNYVVKPLYSIFPKPSEFYRVVNHLSDSGDTRNNLEVDLTNMQSSQQDPFSPLWSGLGFMAVMLLISCTMFHFKDF